MGVTARPRRVLVTMVAGMALGLLIAELDQAVFGTALPTILGDLGGVEQIPWVNTAYVLAATLAMPAYGVLGDRHGRRPLLLVAVALLMVGSVLGGAAGGVGTLLLARAVQGLGGGGMLILVQATVADVIPARRRQAWMSAVGVVFAVAAVGGPALGGWLAEDVGWRWVFWLNLPLGVAALLAIATLVPGARTQARTTRPVRALVSDTLALLRTRAVGLPVLAGAVLGITVFGVVGYLPTYAQMAVGLSPTRAGLLMLALAGGIAATTVISAQVVRRTGRYRALPVLGGVLAAGALVLLAYAGRSGSPTGVGAALVVLGAGIGCAWEVLVVMVQNASPADRVGTVTATNGFFREVGASAGVALVGVLVATRLGDLAAVRLAGLPTAPDVHRMTPVMLRGADAATRAAVVSVYRDAFFPVLLAAVPLLLAVSALLLLVPRRALADASEPPRSGEPAAPVREPERVEPVGPRFSVVIPAHNEADLLPTTLRSLARQDFTGPVEVIVVDNGSTDATAAIARAHGARVVHEPRLGVCSARQRGTEAARGEFVVSTDADTIHPTDWLSRLDARLRAHPDAVAVAGPCRYLAAPPWAAVLSALSFATVGLVARATGRPAYLTATNVAFRRAGFAGYDTTLTQGGDEVDLLRRLRRQGPMLWDRHNAVETSSRRLDQGFAYTVVVSFGWYYAASLVLNRLGGRTVIGAAPPIRPADSARVHRRRRAWGAGFGLAIAAVAVLDRRRARRRRRAR